MMALLQTLISKLTLQNKRQLRNLSRKSNKNNKQRNKNKRRRTQRSSRPPLRWQSKTKSKLESKPRSKRQQTSKSKVVNKGKHRNNKNKPQRVNNNNKQTLNSSNQPSSLFFHSLEMVTSPSFRARRLLCKVNQKLISFLMSLMAKRSYLLMVRSPNHQLIQHKSSQMHNHTTIQLERHTTLMPWIARQFLDPKRAQPFTPISWMDSLNNCHILMRMIKSMPTPNFPLVEKTTSCSRLIVQS